MAAAEQFTLSFKNTLQKPVGDATGAASIFIYSLWSNLHHVPSTAELNQTKLCATHRHVWSAPCIPGFGDGVHQLTTDAKVTQLYVAVPVQEDVWRLNVWQGKKRRSQWKENWCGSNNKTGAVPGVVLPLCIIFKFSFKWLSAFTVCKISNSSLVAAVDNVASLFLKRGK